MIGEPDPARYEKRSAWWFWVPVGVLCSLIGLILMLGTGPLAPWYHGMRAAEHVRRGREAAQRADWVEADLRAMNALRHRPGDVDAMCLHAEALEQRGDARALSAWLTAQTRRPDDPELVIRTLNSARQHDRWGQLVPRVAGWVHAFPTNGAVWRAAGQLARTRGEPGTALRMFRDALGMAPDDVLTRLELGDLLVTSAKAADREEGGRLLDSLADDPQVGWRARVARAAGTMALDPAASIPLWDALMTARPDDATVRMRRLEAVLRSGGTVDDAQLKQVLAGATDAAARLEVIDVLARLAGPEAVIAARGMLPERERGSGAVTRVLCRSLFERGRLVEVLQLADVELKRRDVDAETTTFLWMLRARTYLSQGDTSMMKVSVEGAIVAAERDPASGVAAGAQMLDWGMRDPAAAILERIAQGQGPAALAAMEQLIRLAEREQSGAALLRWVGAMARIRPDDLLLRNNLAALTLLLKPEDPQGFQIAERAYRRAPNNPQVADTWATALWRRNRPNEALQVYESLPRDVAIGPAERLHRALVLRDLGRNDEARALAATVEEAQLLVEERALLSTVR